MSQAELQGNLLDEREVTRERQRFHVRGQVQGVGFRPFVYRLARRLDLAGWVANSADGAVIEVEGRRSALDDFARCLEDETPLAAEVDVVDCEDCSLRTELGFEIRPSVSQGRSPPVGLADRVTCEKYIREIRDPADRRHNYPFTSCTACGPRYSIVDTWPYDRASTAMASFTLCAAFQAEYDDPADRRFHAEANACPDCGPELAYQDEQGETLATRNDALNLAAADIRAGKIIALKGLGGFQLVVDARNDEAVRRLRTRTCHPFGLPGGEMAIREPRRVAIALLLETFGGVVKEINLAFTPEAEIGDYVLVHVGFAISVLNEAEAQKVLAEHAAFDELEEARSTLAGGPAS